MSPTKRGQLLLVTVSGGHHCGPLRFVIVLVDAVAPPPPSVRAALSAGLSHRSAAAHGAGPL